jgi:hypothetical protein
MEDSKHSTHDVDKKMFETFVTKVFTQQERVKNEQLSENDIKTLLNIVDLKTILKHQKMSLQFIKENILPLLDKENKSDPTRSVTLDKIVKWQQLDSISLLID